MRLGSIGKTLKGVSNVFWAWYHCWVCEQSRDSRETEDIEPMCSTMVDGQVWEESVILLFCDSDKAGCPVCETECKEKTMNSPYLGYCSVFEYLYSLMVNQKYVGNFSWLHLEGTILVFANTWTQQTQISTSFKTKYTKTWYFLRLAKECLLDSEISSVFSNCSSEKLL